MVTLCPFSFIFKFNVYDWNSIVFDNDSSLHVGCQLWVTEMLTLQKTYLSLIIFVVQIHTEHSMINDVGWLTFFQNG